MVDNIRQRIEKIILEKSPTGYRWHHRMGVIPDDWGIRMLRDITIQISEKARDRELESLSISAGIGFVNQAEKFGKELSGKQYVNYTVIMRGDFVYNKGNSKTYPQGCIYRLDDRKIGAVPNVFISFRLKEKGFDSEYYKHLFISGFLNYQLTRLINAGVRNDGLLNLYAEDFFSCSVPVPPQLEQQKIAEILNLYDKNIDLKHQLIEQEQKRKKWLLQNLLDPLNSTRFLKFKGKWKKKTMGDLFSFSTSYSASRAKLGTTGVCYLHYGDIHSNNSTTVDVDRDYDSIPKIDMTVSKTEMLQNGDVVFVDASEDYPGVSKHVVVINPRNVTFIPGLHTIPAKSKTDELDIDFKKYCFQSPSFRKQASFYASGMKVYGLSRSNLAKIVVFFPEKQEQQGISKILMTQDLIIDLSMQELHQLQLQKKSLMQLLLTGIVRVSV